MGGRQFQVYTAARNQMAISRSIVARVVGGLLALLPAPIWACSCAVSPVQYCQRAPDPSNQQQAVFVGTVREFYPKSREQMNQLYEQFYRSHPELFSQSGNRSSRRIVGAPPDDQEFRREFIRFLWGDSLTAVEQEQLRDADQRALDRLMFDYRRRARLQVLEKFSNAESLEFELFTNLDGPSCGFDFIEGETYLVEAYRNDSNQRWMVGSCTPPRLVSASTDELNALRAWKAGHPPTIRIFGNVFSPDGRQSPAGIRLQLLGGTQPLETVSDSYGEFQFQNLAAGIYQLMGGAAAPRARSIDLTSAWCARVMVPLDRR
jgi:hypothetical protein